MSLVPPVPPTFVSDSSSAVAELLLTHSTPSHEQLLFILMHSIQFITVPWMQLTDWLLHTSHTFTALVVFIIHIF